MQQRINEGAEHGKRKHWMGTSKGQNMTFNQQECNNNIRRLNLAISTTLVMVVIGAGLLGWAVQCGLAAKIEAAAAMNKIDKVEATQQPIHEEVFRSLNRIEAKQATMSTRIDTLLQKQTGE